MTVRYGEMLRRLPESGQRGFGSHCGQLELGRRLSCSLDDIKNDDWHCRRRYIASHPSLHYHIYSFAFAAFSSSSFVTGTSVKLFLPPNPNKYAATFLI